MASTVKLLGSEVAVSNTASNIGNAKLVRIYNGHASDQLVTIKSGSNVVGTVTLVSKEVVYLMKLSQETIVQICFMNIGSVNLRPPLK